MDIDSIDDLRTYIIVNTHKHTSNCLVCGQRLDSSIAKKTEGVQGNSS